MDTDANLRVFALVEHEEASGSTGTLVSAVTFSLFALLAACGNALVIVVFLSQPSLRSSMNMYLASLALSDLIVATLVMPLGIAQHLHGGQWIFGRTACDLWHATDVCASTASILNLCFIAIERYEAIRDPIKHQAASGRRTATRLCSVWILSAIISFPAIVWWHQRLPLHLERHQIIRPHVMQSAGLTSLGPDTKRSNNTDDLLAVVANVTIVNYTDDTERAHTELLCEFTDDPYYLIASSMISFYIPCALMIVVYSAVYRTAVRVRKGNVSGCRTVASQKNSTAGAGNSTMVLRVHRGGTNRSTSMNRRVSATSTTSSSGPRSTQKQLSMPETERMLSISAEDTPNCPDCPLVTPTRPKDSCKSGRFHNLFGVKEQLKRLVREQKAAKMLGNKTGKLKKQVTCFDLMRRSMIMAVFCISWTPFFVCNLLIAFQSLDIIRKVISEEHEELVMTTVTWLGYASSCLNPFIYALTLREFRSALLARIFFWRPLRRVRKTSYGAQAQARLNGASYCKYESESAVLEALERRCPSQ